MTRRRPTMAYNHRVFVGAGLQLGGRWHSERLREASAGPASEPPLGPAGSKVSGTESKHKAAVCWGRGTFLPHTRPLALLFHKPPVPSSTSVLKALFTDRSHPTIQLLSHKPPVPSSTSVLKVLFTDRSHSTIQLLFQKPPVPSSTSVLKVLFTDRSHQLIQLLLHNRP